MQACIHPDQKQSTYPGHVLIFEFIHSPRPMAWMERRHYWLMKYGVFLKCTTVNIKTKGQQQKTYNHHGSTTFQHSPPKPSIREHHTVPSSRLHQWLLTGTYVVTDNNKVLIFMIWDAETDVITQILHIYYQITIPNVFCDRLSLTCLRQREGAVWLRDLQSQNATHPWWLRQLVGFFPIFLQTQQKSIVWKEHVLFCCTSSKITA